MHVNFPGKKIKAKSKESDVSFFFLILETPYLLVIESSLRGFLCFMLNHK